MRTALLLLSLGCCSCLPAQVLTRAIVHESADAAPQATVTGPVVVSIPIATSAPSEAALPAPTSPEPEAKPLPAPNDKLRALAAKYDVSKIGNRQVASGMNFFSLDRESEMGRELAREVDQSARMFTDPSINEYVNRLAQRLVKNSDARVPFTVKIVDDDEVNAFALPGGFFYVNTGLLAAAENESELAGVMAHEIAHVAARHATRNETKSELFNFASLPLAMLGGPAAFALRSVASIAAPMGYMKFSRDAEREADLLGIEYAYATGYDPRSMIDLLERISANDAKKKKPGRLSRAFSTHPMTSDRIVYAQQEIAYILPPKHEYVVTTSEFEEMKSRLNMLQARLRVRSISGGPSLKVKEQASRDAINTKPAESSSDSGGPVLRRRDLEHDRLN